MDKKGLRASLVLAAVCLLVALIALTAVTYAWFTFDPYTNVTPYEGKISRGEANLEISDKPTTGFGKSCKLPADLNGTLLYPISTENLEDFFISVYQKNGISRLFRQVSKDAEWKPEDYLIHGTLYLRATSAPLDVYLDKPPLDFGTDAQWLAAGRLGLKITGADKKAKTLIFSLDELRDGTAVESKVTILPPADQENKALVIRSVDTGGAPTFADDPAEGLKEYFYTGGTRPLTSLAADEVATVEYWLYLEGCDTHCINPVQARSLDLQFGFAGKEK